MSEQTRNGAPPAVASVPRIALTIAEAARALGCSEDHFRRWILPELRTTRRGRIVFIAVAELERWLERNAARGEW